MYGQEATLREQIVAEYKDDLIRLLKYLPYLEKKNGAARQDYYEGDGNNKVIPVPVYDSTLLNFVKEARQTKFVTKNYPYTYRKWKMPDCKAELVALESATIRDIDMVRGVFSKYVLEGQTKSVMWTRAVEEGIFVSVLKRLNSLIFDYSNEPKDKRPQA